MGSTRRGAGMEPRDLDFALCWRRRTTPAPMTSQKKGEPMMERKSKLIRGFAAGGGVAAGSSMEGDFRQWHAALSSTQWRGMLPGQNSTDAGSRV